MVTKTSSRHLLSNPDDIFRLRRKITFFAYLHSICTRQSSFDSKQPISSWNFEVLKSRRLWGPEFGHNGDFRFFIFNGRNFFNSQSHVLRIKQAKHLKMYYGVRPLNFYRVMYPVLQVWLLVLYISVRVANKILWSLETYLMIIKTLLTFSSQRSYEPNFNCIQKVLEIFSVWSSNM